MKLSAKILSFTIILALLFSLCGCSSLVKKAADKAKAEISDQLKTDATEGDGTQGDQTEGDQTEDTTQGDTTDNGDSTAITTSEGKGMSWPSDGMGPIPEVKNCKINGVYSDSTTTTVSFEGMKPDYADSYIQKLKDLGFTDGAEGSDDSGLYFMNSNAAGDSVWFSYASDGTGMVYYTLAST